MIKPKTEDDRPARKKKTKQPTQRPPMQPVMVIKANGKRRMEWRPW